MTGREFLTFRLVLEGKAKVLCQQGRGKRSNKSCSLTKEEREKFC